MAQRLTASDRLPWLTEVPRTPPPPVEPRRKAAPWAWLAGAAALLGVGGGAYWLGMRQAQPEAAPPGATEVILPEARPAPDAPNIPSVSDITAGDELTAEPKAEAPERQILRREPARPSAGFNTRSEPEPAADSDPAEAETLAVPPPLPPLPLQPVVRGRIVQLGAYPTRVQADFAWRAAVKRFPYLASKPRLISPIEVRSTDGKPTRMYRLQLATASQAQSVVICQQLEGVRQSCVVVY